MIDVNNLSKSFGEVKAVSNVSFKAEDGQITGLLGPNGAGKSTTIRMLSTLIKPDSGSALIDGFDSAQQGLAVRSRLGILSHNAGIYPRLTAKENVEFFGQMCGLNETFVKSRVETLVEQLEMTSFADRRAKGFSQGQRTKVALARALVHEPKNLLLDEPTNGLDVMATRSLRRLIMRLRDAGHCILFSSHIMQEVAALCDDIVIIAKGEVTMQGSIEEIKARTQQEDLEEAFIVAAGLEEESA